MYSRARNDRERGLVPPPGYRGNRFTPQETGGLSPGKLPEAFSFVGKEELLIIGLILLLAGEKESECGETVLVLILLLLA